MARATTKEVFEEFSSSQYREGSSTFYDEELDFTPQNGCYVDEESMDNLGYVAVEEEIVDEKDKKKVKKEREKINIKAGIDKSIKNFNSKVANLNAKMKSEVKQSLKQPLITKVRVEAVEVRTARQLLTEKKTPSELAAMKHPFDIPLPKFLGGENKKAMAQAKANDNKEEVSVKSLEEPKGSKMYQTLPRSWRETQLVTATKENQDPEMIALRQELIKEKTPGELAHMSSITDFPVPSKISNLFHSDPNKKDTKKRRHSATSVEKPKEPFSLYGTLPHSMRETKLVTNVVEMTDEVLFHERQELVRSKTPAELAEFKGIGDFPIPAKIENLFKPRSRSSSRSSSISRFKDRKKFRSESLPRSFGTLPKSWRDDQLLTGIKVDKDPEVTARRRALVESKSPAELAKITSVADLPVPTPLQNMLKKRGSKLSVRDGGDASDRSPSRGTMKIEDMYDNLPRSLKIELLVSSSTSPETDEVTRKRQKLVETKSTNELAQIGSLSEFPVPTALENIFKEKSTEEKRKRNKTITDLFTYEGLPSNLKKELLVTSKFEDDPELLQKNKELCETKNPGELGKVTGFSDFPLPNKIESLVRPSSRRNLRSIKQKEMTKKRSKSWSSLATTKSMYDSLPRSLKAEVMVRSTIEDPEVQQKRAEAIKNKSVSELAQIKSISEFPLPEKIEGIVRPKSTASSSKCETPVSRPDTPRSFKESFMKTLPGSMKAEVLVRVTTEDPEVQRHRQELTRSKTPSELSQITSVSDIPIPAPIEHYFKKNEIDEDAPPVPPPRRMRKEDLYESLPSSLKAELLVRSKVIEDEDLVKERQELVRSMSPAQLSEMRGIKDFPIPEFLHRKEKSPKPETSLDEEEKKGFGLTLPKSLTAEVMVRSLVEKPEIQKQRAETVKSKSVQELSKISSLAEFPLPANVENILRRRPRPVERRKKFREMQRSQSAKSLGEQLYGTLPKSLKSELLVVSRMEDPETMHHRRELAQSKSVGELSQIRGLSDFPIPAPIERAVSQARSRSRSTHRMGGGGSGDSKRTSVSNVSTSRSLYSTLPKSLTADLLVRNVFEDPKVLEKRREIAKSKSVSELAQVSSIHDFPVPERIEKWLNKLPGGNQPPPPSQPQPKPERPISPKERMYESVPSSLKSELRVRSVVEDPSVSEERRQTVQSKSVSELSQIRSLNEFPVPTAIENLMTKRPKTPTSETGEKSSKGYDIYASLPRSLKKELAVQTQIEDEGVARERKALVESTSPAKLSQINSFKEIPVPKRIEAWLHTSEQANKLGEEEVPPIPTRKSRSFHELSTSVYDTLPKALKEPTLVRSKIEDPKIIEERRELTRSKTPSELAEIHGIKELPIPGINSHKTSSLGDLSSLATSVPKTRQEVKEVLIKTILPESMVRPCIVRSKVENHNTLLARQALQQSKSIHELSKIRNLNEFPMPGKLKLPDIPLPSAKSFFKKITKKGQKPRPPPSPGVDLESSSPIPTAQEISITDDEMLRYEASTPGGDITRDQDFGYEIIANKEAIAAAAATGAVDGDVDGDVVVAAQEQQPLTNELETVNTQDLNNQMPEPPKPGPDEEERSLIEQYRGSPERTFRSKRSKRNTRNRRSQETPEEKKQQQPYHLPSREQPSAWLPLHEYQVHLPEELPPPIPPKRPTLGRGGRGTPVIVDDDHEVVPVSLKASLTIQRTNGDMKVVKKEVQPKEIDHIQARPLPPPPPPLRTKKNRSTSPTSSTTTDTGQYHTVQSTLDQTLVGSQNRQRWDSYEEETLADSVVDSLHSCAETLIDDDPTIHEDLEDFPFDRPSSSRNRRHQQHKEIIQNTSLQTDV